MRDVPFPEIPSDEFAQRKDRAITLMAEHGLDGLLLFNPMNMNYYSGFRKTWTLQWMHRCNGN
jgi:Xaa-Pro aminopeptidase